MLIFACDAEMNGESDIRESSSPGGVEVVASCADGGGWVIQRGRLQPKLVCVGRKIQLATTRLKFQFIFLVSKQFCDSDRTT